MLAEPRRLVRRQELPLHRRGGLARKHSMGCREALITRALSRGAGASAIRAGMCDHQVTLGHPIVAGPPHGGRHEERRH